MTCKACGRDVPLNDINCFDCNAEGPFTRASRLTPWERGFAWLPMRLSAPWPSVGGWIWLRHYEHRTLHVFGRGERSVRIAAWPSRAT